MSRQQISEVTHEQEYSYFNLTVWNDSAFPISANIDFTVRDIILNKPEDYLLSLIRFSIPNNFMPLLNVQTLDFVNLKSNGNEYSSFLGFAPDQDIFTVQQFLEALNSSLATAFIALKAAEATAAVDPPRMVWDKETNFFTLMVPFTGYRTGDGVSASGADVEILFSSTLYELFAYIRSAQPPEPAAAATFTQQRIVVSDQENLFIVDTPPAGSNRSYLSATLFPAGTYFQVKDEYPSIQFWQYTSKLTITSNAIPVLVENGSDFAVQGDPATNERVPILTDFNINSNDATGPRGIISFFSPGQWRFSDMSGGLPFRKIGLSIFRTNKDGTQNQLMLPPDRYFSVKIAFVLRSSVKNRGFNA